MKRPMIIACAALVALTAAVAFAVDVTGKWTGQFGPPDGDGPTITFNFKQDGAKLTGTVQGPQGEPIEIKDGKVDGDKIAFTVSFSGGGREMKITHDGTVNGDEITLNSKFEGGEGRGPGGGPMKLKRAK